MAQKTKKSPTSSTAKKTGAELPVASPKGVPPSVPPDAVARLRTVAQVDHNEFIDMVPMALSEAESRVALLLGDDSGAAPAAAVDAFLVDVLLNTPAEEIVRRGGSAEAFVHVTDGLEALPPDFEPAWVKRLKESEAGPSGAVPR